MNINGYNSNNKHDYMLWRKKWHSETLSSPARTDILLSSNSDSTGRVDQAAVGPHTLTLPSELAVMSCCSFGLCAVQRIARSCALNGLPSKVP